MGQRGAVLRRDVQTGHASSQGPAGGFGGEACGSWTNHHPPVQTSPLHAPAISTAELSPSFPAGDVQNSPESDTWISPRQVTKPLEKQQLSFKASQAYTFLPCWRVSVLHGRQPRLEAKGTQH